jgi:hypothetical protein
MGFYFLGDFERAVSYYEKGLAVVGLNAPYTAPLLNWKYLSLCQMGKKDSEEAQNLLKLVNIDSGDAHSIYKNLILLQRNLMTVDEAWALVEKDKEKAGLMLPTMGYAIAAKYYFDDEKAKARETLQAVLAKAVPWNTWGYIACGFDLERWF